MLNARETRTLSVVGGVLLSLVSFGARAELGCRSGQSAELPELVDRIAAIDEGSWLRLNSNRFADVWPPLELRAKPTGLKPDPAKIIRAWSSFAWDCRRGDLLIYGGGHANYAGNDTYRWRASTGLWERMSLSSEIVEVADGIYAAVDGVFAAPVGAHTYDNNIYLPAIDRFLVVGGSAWNNGGAYLYEESPGVVRHTGPYMFDPARADPWKVGGTTGSHVQRVAPYPEIIGGMMWQNRDLYSILPVHTLPANFTAGTSAYVSGQEGDTVLFTARAAGGTDATLYKYRFLDPDDALQDSVERVGRYVGGAGAGGAGAYDPHANLFVRTAKDPTSGLGEFYYWNLATPGPTNPNVIFVPTDLSGGWAFDRQFGMDYDPVRRQYLLWGGDAQVWSMRAPQVVSASGWTIEKATSVTPQGAPAFIQVDANIGGRVLGKWKYIPELDAFMGLEDPAAGNVWIYKPVGWRRPGSADLPAITLTVQPSKVAPGGSSLLTWNAVNANSCTAEGGLSGPRQTAGSESTDSLAETTSFGLRCSGPGGESAREVKVTVELPAPEITSVSAGACLNSDAVESGQIVEGSGVPGALVQVSLAGLIRSATVATGGIWSVSFTRPELEGIADGSLLLTAQQEDSDGNVSALRSLTLLKDTVSPQGSAGAPDLLTSSDTGGSSTDDVTRDNTPTLSGVASAGATVVLLLNGEVATQVKTSSSGVWTATPTRLSDGVYVAQSTLADTCGNRGPLSSSLQVRIDTARPALSLDTVAGDNRVNAAETAAGIVVTGSAEDSVSVRLEVSAGGTVRVSRSTTSASTWSIGVQANELGSLPEGSTSFKATATDAAGNVASVTRTVLKDTQVAPPTIGVIAGDDVLSAAERGGSVTLIGSTESSASVALSVANWSKTVSASSTGTWSTNLPATAAKQLPLGILQLQAIATDRAGNVSLAASRTFSNQ